MVLFFYFQAVGTLSELPVDPMSETLHNKIPNWELVSEIVNATSVIRRSARQVSFVLRESKIFDVAIHLYSSLFGVSCAGSVFGRTCLFDLDTAIDQANSTCLVEQLCIKDS